MMARVGTPTFLSLRIAAVAVAAVALSGCDWRLETPPPSVTPASQEELARDALAHAAADLVAVAAERPAPSALLQDYETSVAQQQLDALGGVYVAHPSATPSPAVADDAPASVAAAAAELRDAALLASLDANDPGTALLYGSIGLSQALAVARADWVTAYGEGPSDAELGGEAEPTPPARVAERPLAGGSNANLDGALLPAPGGIASLEAAGVPTSAIDTIIEDHDRLNYTYEILRARYPAKEFRIAARDRQDIHWRRADALVAEAGRDPRSAAYVIDRAALDDADAMHGLARSLELDLAAAYMAAYGDAIDAGAREDAAWLLGGAFDAYMAAFTWWGGDAETLDAFPGVDVA